MTDPADHDVTERAALYVAGALTDDDRVAVERRLRDGDRPLRDAVAAFDDVVVELARAVDPVAPDPASRDALLASISPSAKSQHVWNDWAEDEISSGGLFTLKSEEGGWEETGVEGITVRKLFVDRVQNRMTAMFRMAPGTEYVPHVHDQPEECYVLEGDLHVGDTIVMKAGDYQRAPAGSHHGVQRTEGGCLLLITCSMSDELV